MRPDVVRMQMRVTAGVLLVLSCVCAGAEHAGLLVTARTTLHDLVSPARFVLLTVSRQPDVAAPRVDQREISQQAKREAMMRQLLIENARMRRELHRRQDQNAGASEHVALLQMHSVPARVLSATGLPDHVRELLVDAGRMKGFRKSELVVDGTGGLLDAGRREALRPGDKVLDGSCVVGRIEQCGQWVSLVQPVSATGFRAGVRILRVTPEGAWWGAEGILEGTGDGLCALTGIPHTEAVSVGDQVVSAEVNDLQGPRLVFGTIVQARFLAGGQWDIRVKPAAELKECEEVRVLCWELNPDRVPSTAASESNSTTELIPARTDVSASEGAHP